jgi:sensor histidine kinase YesM
MDMKINMSQYKNSLVLKFVLGMASATFVFFSMLIISNAYSLSVIRNNIVNSAENEMKIHMRDINNSFSNALDDLNEIALNYSILSELKNNDESKRYFASIKLSDVLSERINISKTTDILSVYSVDYDMLLLSCSNRISLKEKLSVSDAFKKEFKNWEDSVGALWTPTKIGDKTYFFKVYNFSGIIIASFIKADTLMSLAKIRDFSADEQIVLTDDSGNFLAGVGNTSFPDINYPLDNKAKIKSLLGKYLMVSVDVNSGHARLSTIIKETSVFSRLEYIQYAIAFLGVLALVLMAYVIYYLNKEIIRPVKALVAGTHQLELGNWDYQLKDIGKSREFQTLGNSFNSMAKEIKDLKISAYEEKIALQKAELKYLQMQIKPHFFLNALTTVSSLTYKNKSEDIRKFVNALSNHLRYMLKSGLNMVSIKEEVEYIKNYFCMQEIKFPNSVFYVFDMDSDIEDEQIPQFVIHTFIENSFKHAMTFEEPLSIFVSIKRYSHNNGEAVKIIIEDNGEGFPQDVIEAANASTADCKDSGGHKVGIYNVKRTLALFYGENGLLKLSNAEPSGARVEIIIPMQRGDNHDSSYS